MSAPLQILFLAFPGMQALDLVGPHQMFAGANRERPGAYALQIAAERAGPVACGSGLTVMADCPFASLTPRRLARIDTLIAPGGEADGMEQEIRAGRLAKIVARANAGVRRIASVCSGAFFLAEAGLLNGRCATTHWAGVRQLRERHPGIDVQPDAIFVRAGKIWTSAGVTAGIDLALAMIEEDHGRALALRVARWHLVSRIRAGGQSQFSAELDAQAAPDSMIGALAGHILAAPDKDWRLDALAQTACTSPRTLTRAFARAGERSPAAFVEHIRLDVARRLLVETSEPIESIARISGFGALRRLDRAFQRAFSTSPGAFRARFSSHPPEVSP